MGHRNRTNPGTHSNNTALAEDTIVLYTSDNGACTPRAKEKNDQDPLQTDHFRGMKYDVLEGGIRVPGP